MAKPSETDLSRRFGSLSDKAQASELMYDFLAAIRRDQMQLAIDCWQALQGHAECCDLPPLDDAQLENLSHAAEEPEWFGAAVSDAVAGIRRAIAEKRFLEDRWNLR